MKKVILLCAAVVISACTSPAQIQQQADHAYREENQLWSEVEIMAGETCPRSRGVKGKIAQQECLEDLIRSHVKPKALYPNLIEYMLTRTNSEAHDYASGKISKKTYEQNVYAVTQAYWASWRGMWNNKIESASTSNFQGVGDILLGGVQGYNAGSEKRRQEAESKKTLYCTTYGTTARCNQF